MDIDTLRGGLIRRRRRGFVRWVVSLTLFTGLVLLLMYRLALPTLVPALREAYHASR